MCFEWIQDGFELATLHVSIVEFQRGKEISSHCKERLEKYALSAPMAMLLPTNIGKRKKKSLWPPPNAFATIWHISQLLASMLQAICS